MDVFKTPGAFSWCELLTPDPARAAEFYGRLFGWNVKAPDAAMQGYRVVQVGDAAIAGIMAPLKDAPAMPPHWGCYVTVANTDETVQRCIPLGGKALMPPMDIPGVGRMAVLQDPQGAVLSVIAYAAM